ncbi:hypothetical protein AC579_4331 [Pseudocercospora musae]|uniref:BTB domain-containing protein n=1 Tax=Pseudocercospora musae TaxID=113226 RepID=A0A139IQY9_9PEZI|nr:hypothetical protein AC579_4331 [Pseudocercospora musae]
MATPLPSTSDKKPSAADFDNIIRISVGKDGQVFQVHKGVLKFYSGYFRSAIENIENGRFKKAAKHMITLPEEKPEVFKLFYGWLYARELPRDDSTVLIELWGFADRRIVPLLQNEAIDAIQICKYTVMKEASARAVYDNTGAGSTLRQFTICSYATCLHKVEKDDLDAWPEEFKDDLLKYMVEQRPKFACQDFQKRDMCEWHVHEEGIRCKKE